MLKTTIEPGLCLGCTCKWANKKTLPQTSSLINERDRHLREFLPCSVIFMSLPLNYNSMIARKPWLLWLLSKPRPLRFIWCLLFDFVHSIKNILLPLGSGIIVITTPLLTFYYFFTTFLKNYKAIFINHTWFIYYKEYFNKNKTFTVM